MKNVLKVLLTICLVIGVSGCMNSNTGDSNTTNSGQKGKAEYLKEQTLNYLEKYDDTFTVENLTLRGVIEPFHTFVVNSSNYDENFHVYIYEEGDSLTFKDDYFQLDMSNEASEYIYSLIQSKLPNASVKVEFLNRTIDYKGEIKNFQDYLNLGEVAIDSFIFIENIDYEKSSDLFKEVALELDSHDIIGTVQFLSTTTDISKIVPTKTLNALLNLETVVASQTYAIDSSKKIITTPVEKTSNFED